MLSPVSLAPDSKLRSGNIDSISSAWYDKDRRNTDESAVEDSTINKIHMSGVSPITNRLFGDSKF